MTGPAPRRFGFAFAPPFRLPLALLGIRSSNTWVTVDSVGLTVRFGPWRLHSSLGNVAGALRTGPYRWWRAIGPHLSLADRGVTFGTTTAGGVCIRFATPVSGLTPGRWLRHPAVTVTVADPDGLIDYLNAAPSGGTATERPAREAAHTSGP
jgi:hypothetical protein